MADASNIIAQFGALPVRDQVRAIRKMREYGSTTTSIAQAFSIHPATVSRIVRHVWRKEVA